jgi:hypothetical protein
VTTYSDLKTQIQDYCQNTETTFVTHLDTFITTAEDRIYHEVRLPNFRKNSTGATTASNQYLSAPTDFLAPHSLAVVDGGSHTYLLNKDVNFIREAYPAVGTEAVPRLYALFDHNTFLLGPTPDDAYTMELHYFYRPETIVTATNTWLGDNFPSILLYACLVEAYTFMKGEEDLIKLYQTQYRQSLGRLKVLGEGKDLRDSYRSGEPRMPVT